jgi:poly-beta-1,6-N-acetyl-D-glucosamine synthase
MKVAEIIFWVSLAAVGYAYVGYPLLVAAAARLRPRAVARVAGHAPSVSIVVAAHNEEKRIGRRVAEFTEIMASYPGQCELLVVSDGSTDRTAAVARAAGPARVMELARQAGKAAALNEGWAAATNEVLVLADVRQTWSPDALTLLVENFADPDVGAVSGDLVIESVPGAVSGVGAYWRYEKWLRVNEGRYSSMTGVTGCICAVRRALYRALPTGTLLDDIHWPLVVVMAGYRVVHDERAKAYDRLPPRTRDEFRRKVRTLSGNFQLFASLPASLLPWKNPVWAQFVSHKLLRLAVPWALLTMLIANALLLNEVVYRALFIMQAGFYLLAAWGLFFKIGGRPASLAAAFVVLNSAAWLAFWVWITGGASGAWRQTIYASPTLEVSDSVVSDEALCHEGTAR